MTGLTNDVKLDLLDYDSPLVSRTMSAGLKRAAENDTLKIIVEGTAPDDSNGDDSLSIGPVAPLLVHIREHSKFSPHFLDSDRYLLGELHWHRYANTGIDIHLDQVVPDHFEAETVHLVTRHSAYTFDVEGSHYMGSGDISVAVNGDQWSHQGYYNTPCDNVLVDDLCAVDDTEEDA